MKRGTSILAAALLSTALLSACNLRSVRLDAAEQLYCAKEAIVVVPRRASAEHYTACCASNKGAEYLCDAKGCHLERFNATGCQEIIAAEDSRALEEGDRKTAQRANQNNNANQNNGQAERQMNQTSFDMMARSRQTMPGSYNNNTGQVQRAGTSIYVSTPSPPPRILPAPPRSMYSPAHSFRR